MSAPLIGAIPPGLDLDHSYTIQFTALNAATGAVDTSVVVSNASLLVSNVAGGNLAVVAPPGQIDWLNLPQ